jgi:O-antigen ligase
MVGIAVSLGIILCILAWRSVAWPVALRSGPAIVVGLSGHNPFPSGFVTFAVAGWMVLAVAFSAIRGHAFAPRALLSVPVIATAVLGILLIVGVGSSPAPDYGSTKVQAFFALNAVSLIAGLVVGRSSRDFDLFRLLALVVGAVTAIAIIRGLATGSLAASVGGRFALNQQGNPIGLGRAAAEAILIGTSIVLASRSPFRRLLALGAMPLIAVSFIAAGSRGPVLGLVVASVALIAMTLRERASRRRSVLLAVAFVAGALLVTQLVPNQNVQRSLSVLTGSGEGLSSNGRTQLWGTAQTTFTQHPLTGIGTGGFDALAPLDVYPHNLFLEVAAELGVLGLIALAAFVLSTMYAIVRAVRLAPAGDHGDVALAAALFVAALVNAQVSGDITTNDGVWLTAGLVLGVAQRYSVRRQVTVEAAPSHAAALSAAAR